MKIPASILLILTLGFSAPAQDFSGLDSLLVKFYALLAPESPEVKCREFDALIAECKDSTTRSHVAVDVFDHYREPLIMGDEEVAVHIFDEWFDSGKCKMAGEFSLMDARLFADFNRSTLLGRQAPEVVLSNKCGGKCLIPRKGRTAILFFYDTSCAKCVLEMEVLPEIMKAIDFPVNFYAVYCGAERHSWAKARRKLNFRNPFIKTIHLWDPELKSDYLRQYGVISTPKLYMTEPAGRIIGRRLEAESLIRMIPLAKTIATNHDTQKKEKGD